MVPQVGDGLVAGLLHRAANLVRGGYCQGDFARDAVGTGVCLWAPEAVAFCLYGAVIRAAGDLDLESSISRAREALAETLGDWAVGAWNDLPTTTPADAVALCLRAREALGGGA